jgi:hypothetical protein
MNNNRSTARALAWFVATVVIALLAGIELAGAAAPGIDLVGAIRH